MAIQTQPSASATVTAPFAQQPVIRIDDQFGNLVNTDNGRTVTATRNAGTTHTIDLVDVSARRAYELPTLGIYKNDINIGTLMVSAPNGA